MTEPTCQHPRCTRVRYGSHVWCYRHWRSNQSRAETEALGMLAWFHELTVGWVRR